MKTTSILTIMIIVAIATCLAASTWTDEDIAQAIEQRISWDPDVSGHGLIVTANEGVVTLEGSVTSYLEIKRAERIAASRKGVRAVLNKVTVDAGPIADADVTASVKALLQDDPAFKGEAIDVSTTEGIVRLSGEIDFYGLKVLVENMAASIIGVRGIENELIVARGTSARSDEEIQSHIDHRFRNDIWLNDVLISVGVENGNVVLSGSAGTLRQLERAIQKAWVPGVISVDSARVQIDPQIRDTSRREPDPQRTDSEIAQTIKDALALHPWVLSYEIDVAVDDGVATLRGTVGQITAKSTARRTAQNTVGVERVNDLVTVKTAQPVEDRVIIDRVKRRLQNNFYTSRYPLKIRVAEGNLMLEGMVETPFERKQAEMLAADSYGVRSVDNQIRTDRMLRGYDPGKLEELGDAESLYKAQAPTGKSDDELQKDIESELYWSWWVDSDAVKVSVEKGIATLAGEVRNEREMRACVANAFDAGAISVVNKLRRKGPETR